VKVVRELNLYHGVNIGPVRLAPPAAPQEIAPTSLPLALTHSPSVAVTGLFEAKKVAQRSS
jgi:capsular polysaccharide biosynthesis protein